MEKSIFSPHYAMLRKKLRELREQAGLTQRDLAKKLRRAQNMVVRLEQGERRVDLIALYWLCKVLKHDPVEVATEILVKCKRIDRGSKKPTTR